MELNEPRELEKFEVGYDGATYMGSYYIADGRIYVSSEYGSKNAALHRSSARTFAKILMREILNAAARHPRA